jgi:hypothetical protein
MAGIAATVRTRSRAARGVATTNHEHTKASKLFTQKHFMIVVSSWFVVRSLKKVR